MSEEKKKILNALVDQGAFKAAHAYLDHLESKEPSEEEPSETEEAKGPIIHDNNFEGPYPENEAKGEQV